jgi:hypothetical protein
MDCTEARTGGNLSYGASGFFIIRNPAQAELGRGTLVSWDAWLGPPARSKPGTRTFIAIAPKSGLDGDLSLGYLSQLSTYWVAFVGENACYGTTMLSVAVELPLLYVTVTG